VAAIDIENPRLLVEEMEVGGEVLDPPRGACETMADMLQSDCWDRKAVYFQGALYVHCQNDSVMRY
jgi:hypothetical protein